MTTASVGAESESVHARLPEVACSCRMCSCGWREVMQVRECKLDVVRLGEGCYFLSLLIAFYINVKRA